MRFRDAVVKRSFGSLSLHHLRSSYYVDLNDTTLTLIESALRGNKPDNPQIEKFVARLIKHGLVDRHGSYESTPFREGSDLISLEIEPFGSCNLRCRHCFAPFNQQKLNDLQFEAILTGASDLGAVEICLNGGEPLLHPHLLDWIDRIVERNFRVVLFSNATLIDDTVADRLARAGIAKTVISLDGFENDHDRLRGSGAFRKTVVGIKRLIERNLVVHTTTMAYPENYQRLGEFLDYCKKQLGVTHTRVSAIVAMGRAKTDPSLLLSAERISALRETSNSKPRNSNAVNGTLPCKAGADKLYIAASGLVYPCHLFQTESYCLGSLATRNLGRIYADTRTSDRGWLIWKFSEEMLTGCSDCQRLKECRGGCRARALATNGQIGSPDDQSCIAFGRSLSKIKLPLTGTQRFESRRNFSTRY